MAGSFVPAQHRRRRQAVARWALGVLLATAWLRVDGASPPGARGQHGIVVSPEARATAIGVEVLRDGGNAVDAGIAVAFALGVTYPLAGSVGGGGLLIYRSPQATYHALDFRETAPADLTAESFRDEDGNVVPARSLEGGLAVGVPGAVSGLAEAHRRWGSRPWRELLAPAIRLAQRGLPVYPWLAETLAVSRDKLMADPEARAIFGREGRPLREGELLVQRDLARTLRRIARHGPAGFYSGPLARAIVESVQDAGGVLTAEDLAAYRSKLRTPLAGHYRGHRVVVFPPPSSGGVLLLQMLGMLERFDLRRAGFGSSLAVHLMAEAERRAFADRSRWLGDPDFFEVPVAALLDGDYLDRRAATIRPDRATPSALVAPGALRAAAVGETLHVSIGDAAGGALTMTLTLNGWYGTGIVPPGTGILLNNEMDDFALAPGVPNLYGLIGGEANAVAGGKRPLSSMSPTIVEAPHGATRPALVLGSPGGSTIITAVLQVLVNVIDHEMTLQEAVDAPRFHHQWLPDVIYHERRAFPEDVRVNLIGRGHALEPSERPLGNVNAIATDAAGHWIGAADPRRRGTALGH